MENDFVMQEYDHCWVKMIHHGFVLGRDKDMSTEPLEICRQFKTSIVIESGNHWNISLQQVRLRRAMDGSSKWWIKATAPVLLARSKEQWWRVKGSFDNLCTTNMSDIFPTQANKLLSRRQEYQGFF